MITKQQGKVLGFIHSEIETKGTCPTYREIAAAMGLKSTGGVHRLVHGLQARGFVRQLPGHGRTIEVLRMPKAFLVAGSRVPVATAVVE